MSKRDLTWFALGAFCMFLCIVAGVVMSIRGSIF